MNFKIYILLLLCGVSGAFIYPIQVRASVCDVFFNKVGNHLRYTFGVLPLSIKTSKFAGEAFEKKLIEASRLHGEVVAAQVLDETGKLIAESDIGTSSKKYAGQSLSSPPETPIRQSRRQPAANF